ncbi:histidinol-phosphatase HisJ [bacterium]|nr:histidinol-phosphatase HisJ [bacterium]
MLDYHIHTRYCGHAWGEMEQYVEHALAVGLDEMGFSCHYPYPAGFEEPAPNCSIPAGLFDEYLDSARELRERYRGRITIRLASEFDYLGPEWPVHPLAEAERLGLDYCLASLHLVEGVVVDYNPELLLKGMRQKGWDMDDLYERYWTTLLELARPGYCTTVGHLDLVKKLAGAEPALTPKRDHSALVLRVLDALAASGTAMEINTSGWDKPCAEQYPSEWIVVAAASRGVPITVGSDSHRPEEVGRKFDRLAALLERTGVRQLVRFEGRRAYAYPLNEEPGQKAAGQ